MKKSVLVVFLIIMFIISGCSLDKLSPEKITADKAIMYYSNRGISVTVSNPATVKELTSIYNNLELKKVEDSLDMSTELNIIYYDIGKEKAVLTVDKNGNIYLYRDSSSVYKILNKDFDYKLLDEIYSSCNQ